MYNGQPPFRPPGNIPPFPPNRPPAPGQAFPPFRPPPPGSFIPPPFPPNFSPGSRPPPPTLPHSPAGIPQTPGYDSPSSSSNGLNFRPPPTGPGGIGYNQYPPPRPAHPGLGLPPLPAGLPQPPKFPTPDSPSQGGGQGHNGAPPGFVRDVKTTSVFVGSIAPGIDDETLKNLLNACGPLHELKRVSGASGKPQAFGFAAYENPEVVLRCIRCLNGVELPDLTPEGRRDNKKKALVVKADQKTQEFLEEFESTLGRSDTDEEADAATRKSISHIVALLIDPSANLTDAPTKQGGGDSPLQVIVPAHLQDLQEGDLPENQRVAVLDQIAIFREASARREKEKKQIEDEKERFRIMQQHQNQRTPMNNNNNSNYGYGNQRGLARQQQQQQAEQSRHHQSPSGMGGQQTPQQNGNGAGPSRTRDPQGYDRPVGFVPAQSAEGKIDSGRTDEEEEDLRRQRRQREKDIALRDAERRVEHRERIRIEALNRELAQRKAHEDLIERNRKRLEDQYENWDDDEIIEKGRELFYTDRATWRARRQRARQQEYQDDVRDRQQEEDELQALERESEEFLKRQMAELAELEVEQKAKGLLTEDAAPIKLNLNIPAPAPEVKVKEEKKLVVPHKPIVLAGDEEEENEQKKKRTFIRLDNDDINSGDGLTQAERIAKRNAKLLEIKKGLPERRRDIFKSSIDWAGINETLISQKIKPFIEGKINELLGELDADLVEFVIEQVKEKKGSDDLVDGLEPILAEEAESFVVQLWKLLIFESEAFKIGLSTGAMMV
ncbi:uncharacterized protein I206_102250 [Kwoniella pini CBS 10737]|uniref:PWI domain-containing protein n=1 Tax=Kwoniella pini CBS 10737 TaxID=1296096 RepID=A0A1B9HSZ0_9TREE|nr:uncharacterized protein I206_07620 [Kwoniella pini CBS 10737]OCF46386.1 hypothetical protein I206_07620 [Kwoniella pini CBS 10737]